MFFSCLFKPLLVAMRFARIIKLSYGEGALRYALKV